MSTEEVAAVSTNPSVVGANGNNTEIDWTEYARAYDLLPELIPQYNDNIAELRETIEALGYSGNLSICDLAAC